MKKNSWIILIIAILTIILISTSFVLVFYADYSYFWFFLNVIEISLTFLLIIKEKIKKATLKDKKFVDRKNEFKAIYNKIKAFNKQKSKILWINISGKPGIGVKSLIYKTYYFFENKFGYECCKITKLEKSLFLYWEEFINIDASDEKTIELIIDIKNKRNKVYIFFIENYIDSNKAYINNLLVKWNYNEKGKIIIVTGTHIHDINNSNNITLNEIQEIKLSALDDEFIEQICRKNNYNNEKSINLIKNLSKGIPAYAQYLSKQQLTGNLDNITDYINNSILNNDNNIETVINILANQFLNIRNDNEIECKDLQLLLNVDDTGNTVFCTWIFKLLNNSIKIRLIEKILYIINNTKEKRNIYSLYKYFLTDDIYNFTIALNALYSDQDYNSIIELVENLEAFNLKNEKLKEWQRNKEIFYFFYDTYLKLGYYYQANEFLKEVELTIEYPLIYAHKDMSLIDIKLYIANIDYYHSINDFEKSNCLIDILQSQYYDNLSVTNYTIQFKFAHNLRHAGKLDIADKLFKNIIENADKQSLEYVRSCYSIISDVIFRGMSQVEIDENRGNALIILNKLQLVKVECNNDLQYSIARHIGIYYKRQEHDYLKCIEYFESIMDIWRKSSKVRILYDFYFEIAEAYRMRFNTAGNNDFYNKALEYYELAILFASQNNDYNLLSNALMGKLLLEKSSRKSIYYLSNQLNYIMKYVEKSNSLINTVNYKIIAKYCINNKNYEDLINFCHDNKWFYHEKLLLSNEINMLQLTVM